ncbi:hypothetical protein GBAR_LOCUS25756, partial [Geodia barretti]
CSFLTFWVRPSLTCFTFFVDFSFLSTFSDPFLGCSWSNAVPKLES